MKYLLLVFFFFPGISSSQLYAQQQTENVIINSILDEINDFNKEQYANRDPHKPLGGPDLIRFKERNEFNLRMLDKLTTQIDADTLKFDDYISWELLRFTLHNDIQNYEFKEYFNPILSESGFHTNVLWRANRTYQSAEQLEQYLAVLEDLPRYFDDYVELMRRGLELGISQPLDGLHNYEATYDPYIVDDPESSIFWRPLASKPDGIQQDEWDFLQSTAREVINEYATPAYENLKLFFENEYYPKARPDLGASSIPNGKAYYEHKVRYYTTLDLTPDEVHEMGLNEVSRIRKEMEAIIADVGFDGSFSEFMEFLRTDPQFYPETGEELLKEASFIAKKVDGRLPSLFGLLPRQPYGVVPVPDYLAPNYTGGRYSGAPLHSDRGGEYWVNTYNLPSRTLYTLPALTLHEAMPGHHLQIALTAEMETLPTFRRNMYINAFGEGWGLYAEYLGHELGIYETPYELFGRYTYEMWRACRLVIDTGIHYKGWSRDEAVKYLADNSALSLHEVNTEINRYITWPGQALAYKVGEMTIKKLREKAEYELGDNFDIKEFHDLILSKGTVTMSILEEMVDRYIQTKNSSD